MAIDGLAIYKKLKEKREAGHDGYDEAKHCALVLTIMSNPEKGTYSAFCVESMIPDCTFYEWLNKYELFLECYCLAKMFSRENWERMGREIKDEINLPGTTNNKFEYWKMIGWSRFGIGKNSRIRLTLDPNAKPNEHYSQLLKQAASGDFTAGEIKQLMEAVNIGMSAHQAFELQKEIDQLKADLAVMKENSNGNNTFADKRTP
jgi:hypothetical protein